MPTLSPALAALESRLAYTFRDRSLLRCAMTHTSYLPEHPDILESNQRLEFLGDAVLQLILTEALFAMFPGDREGNLSRRRATLTKGVFLVELARELSLDTCLLLGSSEESSGGRARASSLEDGFEALVGAIYLDSDLGTTRRVVLSLYGHLPDRLGGMEGAENPKGRLQELVQPRFGNQALRYEVTRIEGEDHARDFEVAVYLHGRMLATGKGSSKKLAEEAAARAALTLGAGLLPA